MTGVAVPQMFSFSQWGGISELRFKVRAYNYLLIYCVQFVSVSQDTRADRRMLAKLAKQIFDQNFKKKVQFCVQWSLAITWFTFCDLSLFLFLFFFYSALCSMS